MNFRINALSLIVGSVIATSAPATFAKPGKSDSEKAFQKLYQSKKRPPPCEPIRVACIKAGFKKGGSKGKAKDCAEKIMAGKEVPGVEIAPEVIESCKSGKIPAGAGKNQDAEESD